MKRSDQHLRPVQLARRITKLLGLSPPIDIEAALAGCGLRLHWLPLPDEHTVFMMRHRFAPIYTVFASLHGDPAATRVALAEYLGVYLLLEDLRTGISRRYDRAEFEAQVQLFAGELLIPEEDLRKACSRRQQGLGCPCDEIRRTFLVPGSYWRRRLRQLGYRNCKEFLAAMV